MVLRVVQWVAGSAGIAPGGTGLAITRDLILPDPPAHLLRREELSSATQEAQHRWM